MRRHWLGAGWKLWCQMGAAAGLDGWDFMLPYPTDDKKGFVRRMVNYAGASGMSQALFNSLVHEEQGRRRQLLAPGVGLVWTEHSERATMRTWAQAARIPEDIHKQMGRGQPSADEAYARAVRVNVLRAQEAIAVFIRDNKDKADPFDESAVMVKITDRMEAAGYTVKDQEQQVELLLSFAVPGDRVEPCRVPRWSPEGEIRLVKDAEPEKGAGLAEKGATSVEEETSPEVVQVESERGRYVLCISARTRKLTLHRIGECHRVPGLHYLEYRFLTYDPPKLEEYHHACRQCFPRGLEDPGDSSEALSSGEASSSSEDESET